MNLAPHPRYGPAGRRALTIVGAVGLLALVLSAVDGSDPVAGRHPVPRGPAAPWNGAASAAAAEGADSMTARATGMRLLTAAATAARVSSYQGMQVISWRIPDGSGSWLGSGTGQAAVDVWHQSGLGTLTRMATVGLTPDAWSQLTDDPDDQLPDGVLGLTPRLLDLLARDYAVFYAGLGSADGRPARIVEVLRPNGTVAAMFWLDSATNLPLRRELFDSDADMISEDTFASLKLGPPAAAPLPASAGTGAGTPSSAVALQPWTDELSAAQLAALRTSGWPVPSLASAGLTLFKASEAATAAGRVIDLSYSDGLSAVSLFVQRGRLPAALRGWRETNLRGHHLFVRDPADPAQPGLTWSADGFVYTVLADAPGTLVAQVVNALPHDTRPGFWRRIGHGVRRLLSWANPFR
ncbi:MAG TPA: hypothetical protein VGI31_04250 [Streptosporangiaceae bacterium]